MRCNALKMIGLGVFFEGCSADQENDLSEVPPPIPLPGGKKIPKCQATVGVDPRIRPQRAGTRRMGTFPDPFAGRGAGFGCL